jgi:hypothetical protein
LIIVERWRLDSMHPVVWVAKTQCQTGSASNDLTLSKVWKIRFTAEV